MTAWVHSRRDAKVRKEKMRLALERNEFKEQSVPREFPAGPMSFPVKSEDNETRRLIDEALARKRLHNGTNRD